MTGPKGTPPPGPDAATGDAVPPQTGRAPGSMAGRTLSGYVWMTSQTVGSQIVNIGGAIVLANLLDEADYGLFVQTVTVSAFGALTQQLGIRSILVNRARAWRSLANPAAWLMAAVGVVIGILMAAASPLVEMAFKSPGLAPLVAFLAIGVPFNAVSAVAEARLQMQLRFRVLAAVQFVRLTSEIVLMILLAWAGLGAWALVIPRLIAIVGTTVVLWSIARPPVRRRPQARRWRYFMVDARSLLTANTANYLVNQLDRIALSIFQSPAVVGIYGFALRLAQRPVQVLNTSLEKVLFPVLRTMHDAPARQAAAFIRAERLLAVIAVPFCLLIGFGAAPLFAVALEDRWAPSVGVLQVIGPAMVFYMVGRPAASMLDAQGRFATRARLNLLQAGCMAVVVIPAARSGLDATVIAMAALTTVFGVIRPTVALWRTKRPLAGALSILTPAVPAGLAAAGVAALAVAGIRSLPDAAWRPWLEGVAIAVVVVITYPLAVRIAGPATYRDLKARGGELVGRVRKRRARGSASTG